MYDNIHVILYDHGSPHPAIAELLGRPEYTVTRVTSIRNVVPNITAETFAVLIDYTFLEDRSEPIHALAEHVAPWCSIIQICDTSSAENLDNVDIDEWVDTSLKDNKLAETVDASIREAAYTAVLHQLYWLHSQIQTLTKTLSPTALEDSDKYAKLQTKLTAVSTEIPEILSQTSIDQLSAVLRASSIRERYLDDPETVASDVRPRSGGKYIPDNCRKCSQSWKSDSPVGPPAGFIPLGAHIWQCTQCRSVYKSPKVKEGSYRTH